MALARCRFQVVDDEGNIIDGASVEVRREVPGLPLVPVFSDRDGAVSLGNPFTAADGRDAGFFVGGGAYKVTATKDGLTVTERYVAVGTAQEQDAQFFYVPRGAYSGVTTYAENDLVESSGALFLSLHDTNVGNTPPFSGSDPTSDTHWMFWPPSLQQFFDALGIHAITISEEFPSGGTNGDLWFKVA